MKNFSLLSFFLLIFIASQAQLRVDIYPTEEFMVKQMLIGDTSVKVWNVHFVGAHEARGVFYNKNTPLELPEGIILSTGNVKSAKGPNKGVGFTTSNRTKGDQDLKILAGFKTYDATYISFEFTPNQDLIRFNYVFASEEYPEYVGSTFNDVFGFFLTDLETGEMVNLALIPNTELPITVNNLNHKTHANFYIKNKSGKEASDALIEYDGLTKPLIAYSIVTPGRKYRIKIAIADVADDAFDSSVFLEGQSFRSEKKEDFFRINSGYFQAFSNPNIAPSIKPIATLHPKTKKISKKDTIPTIKQNLKPSKTKQKEKTTPSVKSTKKLPLPITIYFDFDISEANKTELSRLTKLLSVIDASKFDIRIDGHTDQKGTDSYNQTLSVKRANFIKNWILNNYSFNILNSTGHSFHQLDSTGNTSSSYAKNRRVVIQFHTKKL